MTDELTWQLVGVEVVKEAIKFLYGQAGEALKRWRESKNSENAPAEVPTGNAVPAIFESEIQAPVIHLEAVGCLETDLKQIRADLSNYADDPDEVTLDNPHLLEEVDALRRMLEAIYQQQLTFKGESRPASGPTVEGKINVEEVAGYVAGVRARAIQSGFITGTVEAKRVAAGSSAIGVVADTIG